MPTKVDIGIACAPNQQPRWWNEMMTRLLEADRHPDITIGAIRTVSTAVTDHSKNQVIHSSRPASEEEKRRNTLTDSNRLMMSQGFLEGNADWIWMVDDDTVPPPYTLENLLKPQRDFICGVYFLGGFPHNPIIYNRVEGGLYAAFYNYPMGAMFQVDSVGMGCTLIHRTVFEKIRDGHVVLERPNGSLMPVPLADFRNKKGLGREKEELGSYVKNGVLHLPMRERAEDDTRPWPFYALEYGRTEDHHFCELAANVGIRPWVDGNILCDHLKTRPVKREHNKRALQQMQEEGVFDGK